ncbi:putative ABC-type amino acid transport/signal transduction systems periplasmic component [Klebsiella pneumoniae subsp. rhinoscleromatis]|nr:putative ABC-type amino acid transport/signal transduction systems periplasmic component [Klebsiella pneumoniae subsp. rhinoscleromatis]
MRDHSPDGAVFYRQICDRQPRRRVVCPVFKNRMNALARTADTVTDAAGHSGMKNDNFKDGEMRLTVGLALTLAIMTCGAQARDM